MISRGPLVMALLLSSASSCDTTSLHDTSKDDAVISFVQSKHPEIWELPKNVGDTLETVTDDTRISRVIIYVVDRPSRRILIARFKVDGTTLRSSEWILVDDASLENREVVAQCRSISKHDWLSLAQQRTIDQGALPKPHLERMRSKRMEELVDEMFLQ